MIIQGCSVRSELIISCTWFHERRGSSCITRRTKGFPSAGMTLLPPADQTGALLKKNSLGTPNYFGDGYISNEQDFQGCTPFFCKCNMAPGLYLLLSLRFIQAGSRKPGSLLFPVPFNIAFHHLFYQTIERNFRCPF